MFLHVLFLLFSEISVILNDSNKLSILFIRRHFNNAFKISITLRNTDFSYFRNL